ncbi:hypothetical protein [Microvirga lotononidis]|uniref:Uncharacterized protein n=1 Tax=Microvirga lotononidis TaxID=864069 RepID=I4YSA0_9HYPH|nr:hypothetical protein [Microvirga lotononidis]EIM26842.1 hypothetical protein MicloDRAFT_00033930 [Microvirga lotononidis]WQO31400.1 hypothetical protein U0023_34520 [Microvirga lotononidis]
MPYTLHKLAPGSHDLMLNGKLIGGVVKNGPRAATWTAELLDDAPPETMPAPFTKAEHKFPTLDAALVSLGGAEINEDG